MNRSKVWFFAALIVTFSALILLVTGSSLLTMSLDQSNTVPLGNLITWAGMISLPLAIYWGIRDLRHPSGILNNFLSRLLKITLAMAILWVPLSYLLAGNLSFSFSEKETFQGGQSAMKWFWGFSYGIGIAAISTVLIYWISLLFKKVITVSNNK
jgi:hypothetical protein